MFSHLPDGVFRPQLAPTATPVAILTVTGVSASAAQIEALVARFCPLQTAWKWEAILHKENSFLVNFPSMAYLERLNGSELGIPKQESWVTIDIYTTEEGLPSAELSPT